MILLDDWTTPFGLAPFDQITDDDFGPAMDRALDMARANIDKIANDPTPPTFENVIEAMELGEEKLNQAASTFFILAGADSTEKREELQREFSPKFAAFGAFR